MPSRQRPAAILLVEDDTCDVEILERSFAAGAYPVHLRVARDGVEALEILRRSGGAENEPYPDLVLLDLNMPRKSGQEVLQEMKADENLLLIPVIVFTTSSAPRDILECYRCRANAYMTKPDTLQGYRDVTRAIVEYWTDRVELPRRDGPVR
jgi:CheY-like chemotaxis protein